MNTVEIRLKLERPSEDEAMKYKPFKVDSTIKMWLKHPKGEGREVTRVSLDDKTQQLCYILDNIYISDIFYIINRQLFIEL